MAKLDATLQFGLQAAESEVNAEIAAPPGLEGSQFVVERARFLTGVDPKAHCVDPAPHLPYLEAACYIEPRLLEVAEDTPCEVPVARFAASRAEAFKFTKQVDDAGRLFLARTDEAPKKPTNESKSSVREP